ncbi:MAG: CvpA family protein [Alistipes sp.]|nr:CvpA family protein [Candidatus Alistipes equi]
MNVFDIITILVGVIAIFKGWKHGFIYQLFSLLGIIAGIIVATNFKDVAASYCHIDDARIASTIGFIICFVLVVIVTAILGKLLKKIVSGIGLGNLDILLGICLSLVKYALILCIAYTVFAELNREWKFVDPSYPEKSKTYTAVRGISKHIMPFWEWGKEKMPEVGKNISKGVDSIKKEI